MRSKDILLPAALAFSTALAGCGTVDVNRGSQSATSNPIRTPNPDCAIIGLKNGEFKGVGQFRVFDRGTEGVTIVDAKTNSRYDMPLTDKPVTLPDVPVTVFPGKNLGVTIEVCKDNSSTT